MDPAAHADANDSVRYLSSKECMKDQRRMYNYHVKYRLTDYHFQMKNLVV
jgi:hypothetical protein